MTTDSQDKAQRQRVQEAGRRALEQANGDAEEATRLLSNEMQADEELMFCIMGVKSKHEYGLKLAEMAITNTIQGEPMNPRLAEAVRAALQHAGLDLDDLRQQATRKRH